MDDAPLEDHSFDHDPHEDPLPSWRLATHHAVCRVCGLMYWVGAPSPVCPAKLAARLPTKPLPCCGWTWVPGVLSPINESQRCTQPEGHEDRHRLTARVERELSRQLGDERFETLMMFGKLPP